MAEEMKKQEPRIYGDRFGLAEHQNFVHYARVENNVKREHLLNPEFWSHVSGSINPGDEIKVKNDEFSIYARLLVIDSGSGYAKVHVLEWHDLNSAASAKLQSTAGEPSNYDVLYKGPTMKWIVQRKSDGAVLHQAESQKIAAEAWLAAFIKGGARELEAKAA